MASNRPIMNTGVERQPFGESELTSRKVILKAKGKNGIFRDGGRGFNLGKVRLLREAVGHATLSGCPPQNALTKSIVLHSVSQISYFDILD